MLKLLSRLTERSDPRFDYIPHGRIQRRPSLIGRADAAVREAQRLGCELDRQRAVADAILRIRHRPVMSHNVSVRRMFLSNKPVALAGRKRQRWLEMQG